MGEWHAPDTHGAEPRPHTPAQRLADIVDDYLQSQYAVLMAADVDLRGGLQAVHRTRVASRRYRSVLRVFADLFETEDASILDAELAWYAAVLGAARDAEVLRVHFADTVRGIPEGLVPDRVCSRIDERLRTEQSEAAGRLREEMGGNRYYALLATLEVWHQSPPFTRAAAQPPDAVATYVDAARRTVRKRIGRAGRREASDEELHRARKGAKRARYAAELAVPVLGTAARQTVKRATAVQQILGEHHDTVVARELVLRLRAEDEQDGFAYGVLCGRELHRSDEAHRRLRTAKRIR